MGKLLDSWTDELSSIPSLELLFNWFFLNLKSTSHLQLRMLFITTQRMQLGPIHRLFRPCPLYMCHSNFVAEIGMESVSPLLGGLSS
jgi:hypothetical protein